MASEVGLRAVVTKSGDDKTFIAGDHIVLYKDGTIGCIEAGGWIDLEFIEEAKKGMEYEVDKEYYRRKAELAAKEEQVALEYFAKMSIGA